MKLFSKKLAHYFSTLGFICFMFILCSLALSSFCTTALSRIGDNRMNQQVLLVSDSVLPNILFTSVFVLILLVLHFILNRYVSLKLFSILIILYTAISIWFVLAVGLLPRADSYIMIEASKAFARNDYTPLQDAYFHRYSYQLGLCLIMESICRFFPNINLNLTMQVINCLLSIVTILFLCTLSEQITSDFRTPKASLLLYFLFLPIVFFNMFVYGVLPMMAFYSGAMVFFSLYIQRKKHIYAFSYAFLLGIAVLLKPNAIVIGIALLICAIIYTLSTHDPVLLIYALLSLVLSSLFSAAVYAYYELKCGFPLLSDSSMILRLAMGLQDSVIASGWYNGLLEEYWDLSITPQEEKASAVQMVIARLKEFRQSPEMLRTFFTEKCLTQWSEPSYDILWYARICAKSGRYNGLANMLFRESSSVRALLEIYLNLFQQAAYSLAVIGSFLLYQKKKHSPISLILPVSIIGGFLYHMIFEAKSQYIYPYMLLLIPLASYGLTSLSSLIMNTLKYHFPHSDQNVSKSS